MNTQRASHFVFCCLLILLDACQSDSQANQCDSAADSTDCPAVLNCSAPMQDCRNGPVDGCETDTATDIDNCGSCGTRCLEVANGTPACTDGACGIGGCAAPYLDCNLTLADGCEANSTRDFEHCGDCDTRCPAAPNAAPACAGGKCKLACNAPFLDCNGNSADGCEINTATDINNCGSCGNKCPTGTGGQPACANGTCIFTKCTAPYLTCTAGPADGCETNTSNDVNSCAACGNRCPQVAHGTPGCNAGACGIGSCTGTFKDCNNTPTDGCESDTATDPLHCGSCPQRCNLPNASPTCVAGSCKVGSCTGVFKDCNNLPADGCESNPTTDVNNCGSCGKKCPVPANAMSASCSSSACKFTCLPGFADCDGNAANGCESNSTTDINNCGSCGKKCPVPVNAISASCSSGACKFACLPGFADCDGNAANGCEINTNSDLNNCGGCGTRCSYANGTAICSSSSCRLNSCNAPFGNCDGNPANGCESDTSTDVDNCGTCGKECGFTQWCTTSKCCTFGVYC